MAQVQDNQIRLFDDSPTARAMERIPAVAHPAELTRLAARLPAHIRLGASSWSFPGWKGLVYLGDHTANQLARAGLAAYAAHPLMRTVGLDRAYYQTLSVEQFRVLAEQTPAGGGFRFVVKAHQAVTRPDADERGYTFGDTAPLRESGLANPLFLDAHYATDRIIGPVAAGLRERAGPILFQFPHMALIPGSHAGPIPAFIDRLAAFLLRLPRGPLYAVEVRNSAILTGPHAARYAAALKAAGAAHGFVVHGTMPTLPFQSQSFERSGYPLRAQPFLCLRWILHPTQTHESGGKRYAPFDKIVDDDPTIRAQVAHLALSAPPAAGPRGGAWVIANNNAEGSAPLTLERLARRVVGEQSAAPPVPGAARQNHR